jgi:subtilisin family serine protease
MYAGGIDLVDEDLDPMDSSWGHGTMCARMIADMAPGCDLYGVRVLKDGGGYMMDVAAGVNWCVDHDIDVISMSLGGFDDVSWLAAACQRAEAAGIVLVASAGNGGGDINSDTIKYPARYDSVIAVGAVDEDSVRASFSSTGPSLEVMAPGVGIWVDSTGNFIGWMSGTSLACPHVAGLAALMISAHPEWTNSEIRQRIDATAHDLDIEGRDWLTGYGVIDALDACDIARNLVATLSFEEQVQSMKVTATVSDNGQPESGVAVCIWTIPFGGGDYLEYWGTTDTSGRFVMESAYVPGPYSVGIKASDLPNTVSLPGRRTVMVWAREDSRTWEHPEVYFEALYAGQIAYEKASGMWAN